MMISGLDREIVYAHGWAMSVVPVLDGSFWVDLGRDPPFDVILVFPRLAVGCVGELRKGFKELVGLFDKVSAFHVWNKIYRLFLNSLKLWASRIVKLDEKFSFSTSHGRNFDVAVSYINAVEREALLKCHDLI
jgi:hypothetical protein